MLGCKITFKSYKNPKKNLENPHLHPPSPRYWQCSWPTPAGALSFFFHITKNDGKSQFLMGKSTISMAIFNSYFDITRGYLLDMGKKNRPYNPQIHFQVKISKSWDFFFPLVNVYITNWKDAPSFMGKSTISTGPFSSSQTEIVITRGYYPLYPPTKSWKKT